jgi:hypothetical protein
MRTEVAVREKRSSTSKSQGHQVGDRATFDDVLRVLPSGSLLLMVKTNGLKLTLAPEDIKGGRMREGGEAATLTGTITRVESSLSDDFTPISLAVDGYSAMRVTLGKKWVKPL